MPEPESGGRPPAIVVDGSQNALSVARSLVRAGVKVYTLCDDCEPVRLSRGVTHLSMPDGGSPASFERFLMGPDSDHLAGAVLLACSDPAIEIMARNYETLSKKFRLEESDPKTRLALIDKLETYRLSAAAGIPTVAYAQVETYEQWRRVADTFRFPVVVKPLYSPDAARLGGKIVKAETPRALLDLHRRIDENVHAVAMEFIPGGDDLLCSYYCYMDHSGKPLVEFTKRLLRRSPMHTGSACWHISDWNEEAAALGRKFFSSVGLKGIGNIEFKRDQRDGELKIIEANARFTLGDPLLAAAGVDLAGISYARLTGAPLPPQKPYKRDLVLWLPAEDVRAFFQLRARGEITFRDWFASILKARVFAYFSLRDPLPCIDLTLFRIGLAARFLRARWLPGSAPQPMPRQGKGSTP